MNIKENIENFDIGFPLQRGKTICEHCGSTISLKNSIICVQRNKNYAQQYLNIYCDKYCLKEGKKVSYYNESKVISYKYCVYLLNLVFYKEIQNTISKKIFHYIEQDKLKKILNKAFDDYINNSAIKEIIE